MNTKDITTPNFSEIAKRELELWEEHKRIPLDIQIGEALRDMFNKGYNLGLNYGWAIEQDKNTQHEDQLRDVFNDDRWIAL